MRKATAPLKKWIIDKRLGNYGIERIAIERKLESPDVPAGKKEKLKFRKTVIQRKEIQLFVLEAVA